MNSHVKALSLASGVLLCTGVIYSLQGCHKEPPIGTENATVASIKNNNSSQPSAAATPVATSTTEAAPEVSSASASAPSKEKRANVATHAQQAFASTLPLSDPAPPLSPDPSVLIAEANTFLKQGRANFPVITAGGSGSNDIYIRAAVTRAQRAVDSINQQPEPTDPRLKTQYLNIKRTALAVQAEALNLLASRVDRTQVDAAETAYREYLRAEADSRKVSRAENDLAEMFYTTRQLEKAKNAYRQVLTREPQNANALANLHMIMSTIANEQQSAGQLTEAKTSFAAAVEYAERLREIENANRQPIQYVNGCRFR